jgi:hypothetical protein
MNRSLHPTRRKRKRVTDNLVAEVRRKNPEQAVVGGAETIVGLRVVETITSHLADETMI